MTKKIVLMGFVLLGLFFITSSVKASTLSDALNQIKNLKNEIVQLKLGLKASVYDAVNVTSTGDLTPRISYWQGKVNQHIDIASSTWQTDPDGTSGGELDKLTYCQKWYPNTTSIESYQAETINTWKDRGNIGNYIGDRKMSYKCISDIIFNTSTLKTTENISSNDAFVTASIVGSLLNKDVSYWKLLISCEPGIFVSSYQPKINLCGTEIRMDTYNMANPSEDYLLLTAGAKNNSRISSKLILSLSSYNSKNTKIREDKKEITLPSSNTSTPFVTVLSPNGGETYNAGDQITVKWKTENIPINARIAIYLEDIETNLGGSTKYSITNGELVTNNGEEIVTLYPYLNRYGKYFKIYVTYTIDGIRELENDSSDNTFTINSSTDNGCSNGSKYDALTGKSCPSNSLTLVFPKSGSTLIAGQYVNVKWNANKSKGDEYMYVAVMKDNEVIREIRTVNDGQETIKIPETTLPGEYKIYYQLVYGPDASGYHMTDFAIFNVISNGNVENQCSAGYKFNPLTGQKCSGQIENGCLSGAKYNSITGQVCNNYQPNNSQIKRTLRRGTNGEDVKILQRFLELNDDGIYGRGTAYAVSGWQAENGLTPDGAVGPYTRSKMGL